MQAQLAAQAERAAAELLQQDSAEQQQACQAAASKKQQKKQRKKGRAQEPQQQGAAEEQQAATAGQQQEAFADLQLHDDQGHEQQQQQQQQASMPAQPAAAEPLHEADQAQADGFQTVPKRRGRARAKRTPLATSATGAAWVLTKLSYACMPPEHARLTAQALQVAQGLQLPSQPQQSMSCR